MNINQLLTFEEARKFVEKFTEEKYSLRLCRKCQMYVVEKDYAEINGLCRACNNKEYGDGEK